MAIALRTAILIFGLVTLMAGACRSARAEDPEFLTAPAPSELDAAVREKILTVHVGGSPGADLVVTAFAPQGRGPFPLVVFNHGKNPIPPEQHKRYRAIYAAHYFVSRGYAVLVPMMRGFAGSSGTTYAKGCDPVGMAEKHAHDIADIISQAAGLDIGATIDASRIVVAGQSMGGWDSLAVAALNPPGVKGVIDFSGGYKAPSCPDWEGHLVEGAGKFGRNAREPALWFYGDNDSYFPVALWRRMKEAYAGAARSISTTTAASWTIRTIWCPSSRAFRSGRQGSTLSSADSTFRMRRCILNCSRGPSQRPRATRRSTTSALRRASPPRVGRPIGIFSPSSRRGCS